MLQIVQQWTLIIPDEVFHVPSDGTGRTNRDSHVDQIDHHVYMSAMKGFELKREKICLGKRIVSPTKGIFVTRRSGPSILAGNDIIMCSAPALTRQ